MIVIATPFFAAFSADSSTRRFDAYRSGGVALAEVSYVRNEAKGPGGPVHHFGSAAQEASVDAASVPDSCTYRMITEPVGGDIFTQNEFTKNKQ